MTGEKKIRVIVGMSGGVDSSVAALTLLEQGHEVHGLFMFNWDDDDPAYCAAAQDFQDARGVCEDLGIPLHRADFSREYRECVFRHFLDGYAAGRTPNPDVLCNREIKFGAFLRYARRLGAERIATGHYARLCRDGGRVKLLKGVDTGKDQSYFLHAVEPAALASALFPLGGLEKRTVRRIALERGFANCAKPDSTGICFIGERPFGEFLARFLPARPGIIQTADGEPVGVHAGALLYTVGQRHGLGLGGRRGAGEAPWYVAATDIESNVVVVVQGHDHPLLRRRALIAAGLRWIAGKPPAARFRCHARTRYRQADQACEVEILGDGRSLVRFERAQRALARGQYVVFYAGDECLGGGAIERVIAAAEPATASVTSGADPR